MARGTYIRLGGIILLHLLPATAHANDDEDCQGNRLLEKYGITKYYEVGSTSVSSSLGGANRCTMTANLRNKSCIVTFWEKTEVIGKFHAGDAKFSWDAPKINTLRQNLLQINNAMKSFSEWDYVIKNGQYSNVYVGTGSDKRLVTKQMATELIGLMDYTCKLASGSNEELDEGLRELMRE